MVNQLNFLEETILFRIVTWFPLFLSISRFSINLVKKLNPPLFIKRIFTHLISISGIKTVEINESLTLAPYKKHIMHIFTEK